MASILNSIGDFLLGKRQPVHQSGPAADLPAVRQALGIEETPVYSPQSEEEAANSYDGVAKGKRKGGVLGVLESIFAPEPGSFMHSAYNNTIWNAKAGQQKWKDEQVKEALARQLQERELTQGKTQLTPRGDVIRIKPDGSVEEMYRPEAPPTEVMRLVEQWRASTDPAEKQLLAQAIRGYQYSPQYMQNKTENQIEVEDAKTRGRIKVNAAKPATGGGKGGSSGVIPQGFIPDY